MFTKILCCALISAAVVQAYPPGPPHGHDGMQDAYPPGPPHGHDGMQDHHGHGGNQDHHGHGGNQDHHGNGHNDHGNANAGSGKKGLNQGEGGIKGLLSKLHDESIGVIDDVVHNFDQEVAAIAGIGEAALNAAKTIPAAKARMLAAIPKAGIKALGGLKKIHHPHLGGHHSHH